MPTLDEILRLSTVNHHHLCPRQVLGARLGLYGGELLGLELPRSDKRLLAISETDGCALDGLAAATGCYPGRRTLRVMDFGKVAATLVDTETGAAVRLAPQPEARQTAWKYAPEASDHWQAQLFGYQRMPANELLSAQWVELTARLEDLLSQPGRRVPCEMCGEEILNAREVHQNGMTVCRACAGEHYVVVTNRRR